MALLTAAHRPQPGWPTAPPLLGCLVPSTSIGARGPMTSAYSLLTSREARLYQMASPPLRPRPHQPRASGALLNREQGQRCLPPSPPAQSWGMSVTGAGACVKRNFIGCRGSDEVHEDVVLHDAGLQARLGDRAPGPVEQHLTLGAVGRTASPGGPWARRALGLSPPPPLEARGTGGLREPGGTQRRS